MRCVCVCVSRWCKYFNTHHATKVCRCEANRRVEWDLERARIDIRDAAARLLRPRQCRRAAAVQSVVPTVMKKQRLCSASATTLLAGRRRRRRRCCRRLRRRWRRDRVVVIEVVDCEWKARERFLCLVAGRPAATATTTTAASAAATTAAAAVST